MELAALGSGSVLRDADVVVSRETARQVRLRRLLVVLALGGALVIGRTAAGVVRYMQGDMKAAAGDFHWPHPGIPSSLLPYRPRLPSHRRSLRRDGRAVAHGRAVRPHVLYRPEEIGITLADVVGAAGVVEEVVKTLNLFLAHSTFKERMGGTPRRAILFEGPPGTGKTYIAKAMAAEAGVPFLFVSSSAFQSMYYGQTNRKIRSYFRALHNYARREGGAIGFIEEIDAIGAARGGLGAGPGREGIAGVVNELLIQLQSFDVPPFGTRVANAFIDVANRWLPAAKAIRKRTGETGELPGDRCYQPGRRPRPRSVAARAASTRPSGSTSRAVPGGGRSSTTTSCARLTKVSSTTWPNATPWRVRLSAIRR